MNRRIRFGACIAILAAAVLLAAPAGQGGNQGGSVSLTGMPRVDGPVEVAGDPWTDGVFSASTATNGLRV